MPRSPGPRSRPGRRPPTASTRTRTPPSPIATCGAQFHADEAGTFELVALMPTPYPVPTDGPVGDLLRIARRHPYRPAHIHFIVSHPGYETLITQVFVEGGEMVDTDAVFTASTNMLGRFERDGDGYRLHYDFPLRPGVSTTPRAPLP